MRYIALALLLAGCQSLPPDVAWIERHAWAGFRYKYSTRFKAPGCFGAYVGDCTEFSARVACLAELRGLPSQTVYVTGNPGHVMTLVETGGEWWLIDNIATRRVD